MCFEIKTNEFRLFKYFQEILQLAGNLRQFSRKISFMIYLVHESAMKVSARGGCGGLLRFDLEKLI